MSLDALGEWGVISRIRRGSPVPGREVVVGLGDDAAALGPPKGLCLATTDMMVEGVHFRLENATWTEVGWKALATNVSDVAAMGGTPRYALTALALGPATAVEDVDALYQGLWACAKAYGVELVGGDTCASPQGLVVSITLLGEVEEGKLLRRSGARPGNAILVTGRLGLSAAGLATLETAPPADLPEELLRDAREAHLRPIPRVAEGQIVGGQGTSAIDLSDGLVTDLGHICEESRVGARVLVERLPVPQAVHVIAKALGRDPLVLACSGGEDYELCFTAPPGRAESIREQVQRQTGTPVAIIGEICQPGEGITFLDHQGRPVSVEPGWEHFRVGRS